MLATSSGIPAAPAISTAKKMRIWPAILTLLFLPGITAEMLTGSTPVLVYLTNPFSFITNTVMYGFGAILIREIVRRRGLGWPSIVLLGFCYGIFEEGLVINTWANPWLPQVCVISKDVATGLCDYSRVGDINVAWALSLTIFHAIISITIPILLVELLFPKRAALPWLGKKAPWFFALGEGLLLVLGILLNIVSFRAHGFAGPPVGAYLLEGGLFILFAVLALTRRPPALPERQKPLPRLWTLRLLAAFAIFANTALPTIFQSAHIPFPVELLVHSLLVVLVVWQISRWADRSGWNERYQLALAFGALAFFLVVWDPLLELIGSAGGNPTRGTIAVALFYLIGLILLSRRVKQNMDAQSATALQQGNYLPKNPGAI